MSAIIIPKGHYLNAEAEKDLAYTVQAVGEVIRDMYPDMHLARLDSGKIGLLHVPRDGNPPYLVRAMDDADVNAGLLTWIIERDSTKVDVWATIEKHNAMAQALELKEQQLRMEEGHEFTKAVLKSKKYRYRHDGVIYT